MSRSSEDWKDERMKCMEARKLVRQALTIMDEYNEFHDGDENVVREFDSVARETVYILNTLIGMNTIDWDQ